MVIFQSSLVLIFIHLVLFSATLGDSEEASGETTSFVRADLALEFFPLTLRFDSTTISSNDDMKGAKTKNNKITKIIYTKKNKSMF